MEPHTTPNPSTDLPAEAAEVVREPLGPLELVKTATSQTWKSKSLIGWYLLMYVVFMGIGSLLIGGGITLMMSEFASAWLMMVLMFIGVIVVVIGMLANTGAILWTLASDTKISYWQGWRQAWPNLWSLLIIGFCATALTFLGGIAFLIPGIVLMVYLIFSQFVLANEGVRGTAALVRSTELVRGKWWATFGRILLLGLAIIVIDIGFDLLLTAFGVGLLEMIVKFALQGVYSVFFLVGVQLWYRDMVAEKPSTATTGALQSWYRVGVGLGVLAMLLFPMVLGLFVFDRFMDSWGNYQSDEAFQQFLGSEVESTVELETGVLAE